jgi:hypothetical protein
MASLSGLGRAAPALSASQATKAALQSILVQGRAATLICSPPSSGFGCQCWLVGEETHENFEIEEKKMRNLLIDLPEYHEAPFKPRNFKDFAAVYFSEPREHRGLWCVESVNRRSGLVIAEEWGGNKLLNIGATNMLKNFFNSTGGAINPMKYMAITTAGPITTLSSALTSGSAYTSIPVVALLVAIPSGSSVVIGAGAGTTQTVTTTAIANVGATSITVSFTANANYSIGANVAAQPSGSEDPSSLTGTVTYSSALASGAFDFTTSRQVSIQYTFSVSGSPAATVAAYTEGWMTNTSPVASTGQTAVRRVFNSPKSIDSETDQRITITEQIL